MKVYEVLYQQPDDYYTAYTEVICASRELAEAWIARKPHYEQPLCEIVETEVVESEAEFSGILAR